MAGAFQALSMLADAETNMDPEQLQKQLLKHQIPIAMQVESLVKLLEYQKSLIPKHLINPLIDSTLKLLVMKFTQIKEDSQQQEQQQKELLNQAKNMLQ